MNRCNVSFQKHGTSQTSNSEGSKDDRFSPSPITSPANSKSKSARRSAYRRNIAKGSGRTMGLQMHDNGCLIKTSYYFWREMKSMH